MYYVAYGSNMNLSQMKYRCPNSKVVCNGVLTGWKLVFNIHADIIYTGNKEDKVPVVLWDIRNKDWKSLDMYEGFPKYYIKKNVDVDVGAGYIVSAIVYVMADNRKGVKLPCKSYFESILTGYKENGINTDILYEALTYSAYNETEYNQYNVRKE
ncbi:MAG: gamma-glutamylcyclotransferase [Bacteroidales bacterium]|nr:gamma-glutamylcyclotransferase [Bacteroidales bacterium]